MAQRNANPRSWGHHSGMYENADDQPQNQGFMPQAPAYGRSDRGGQRNRGGRGGRKPNRPPPSHPGFQTVDPEKKSDFPKPQHLSKTSSELKNDPLYDEAFFPSPSEELREISKESIIYPSCDGLMSLLEDLYLQMSAHSHNYKRNVPISAHNYYFAVLTYARLLHLVKLNKRALTYGESQFVQQIMENGEFEVTPAFQKYLSGFGSTNLPCGTKQWFSMHKPTLYSADDGVIAGYFGNIENNPGAYASYPCLAVFAQRIMEDMRYTLNLPQDRDEPAEWDLPDQFAYPKRPINRNCIGYMPAVRLSGDQSQFYATKNVTPTDFGSQNTELPFNVLIMNGVQKFIRENHGLQTVPIPLSESGSQGQLVTALVTNFGKHPMQHTFVAKAPLQIVGSIAYLGSSFLYKFKKDGIEIDDQRHLWPNDFDIAELPPRVYRTHFVRNSVGMDAKLDVYDYESTPFLLGLRLKHITSKDVILKK